MPNLTQYEYIENNIDKVSEPIVIIGSKLYDYDNYDYTELFKTNGFKEIVGIDISEGKNVDVIADITDLNDAYFDKKQSYYNTVICMSVLMYVNNPFDAAINISKISRQGATLYLSEPFIHKSTAMPVDNWRFTFHSLGIIFKQFEFNESLFQCSFTRSNIVFKSLRDASTELLFYKRHIDEHWLAFIIRRVSLKLFTKGFFKISRLMPEISIFAIARKR